VRCCSVSMVRFGPRYLARPMPTRSRQRCNPGFCISFPEDNHFSGIHVSSPELQRVIEVPLKTEAVGSYRRAVADPVITLYGPGARESFVPCLDFGTTVGMVGANSRHCRRQLNFHSGAGNKLLQSRCPSDWLPVFSVSSLADAKASSGAAYITCPSICLQRLFAIATVCSLCRCFSICQNRKLKPTSGPL